MGFLVELLIAFLVVGGALWTVVVGVALMRQRDALSRINAMGPATALGLPMLLVGVFIAYWLRDGFSWLLLFKTLATIGALVIVSSVATNVLARATYLGGTPLDPRTKPNDLDVSADRETGRYPDGGVGD